MILKSYLRLASEMRVLNEFRDTTFLVSLDRLSQSLFQRLLQSFISLLIKRRYCESGSFTMFVKRTNLHSLVEMNFNVFLCLCKLTHVL